MRSLATAILTALALGAAACGSSDDDARPTATPSPVVTRTATTAPTRTASATLSATPTGTATVATRTATPTDSDTATPTGTATATPHAARCADGAVAALDACLGQVTAVQFGCFRRNGRACDADDGAVAAALGALAGTVAGTCPDDAAVHAAGFGPAFTVDGLAARLQDACRAEPAALAARSFGGPQGAALAFADSPGRVCLIAAYDAGSALLRENLATDHSCIIAERDGSGCTLSAVEERRTVSHNRALSAIGAACDDLAALVAVDPDTFANRAEAQARCLTAVAHPDTAPLALDCGPRATLPAAPRGEYVQVVLDEATYGTRCGDGSPFAFWIRLAPAGSPVERVVVGMQGGGVCIFGEDCASRPAGLFEALADTPETGGPLSNDPAVSPFADWTKIYLPYCNQDVFIGGGATSNFPEVTVHRFGAVNVRAALRVARDLIWRDLDATTDGGYRTDALRVLFGGFSAGGFGTLYNYHWLLDDLQWAHTAAYPDASLALDNGEPLGIAALGALLISDVAPLGWGSLDYLPPYCFATNCGVGPVALAATAPRLKAVPEQQFLILSNQVDDTQVGTTFFSSRAAWVNELRTSYCETRALPGVQYFLPAISESVHVISPRPELYTDHPLDGVVLRDWLASGFSAPDAITDHIEEGTLVTDIPGVEPFACR